MTDANRTVRQRGYRRQWRAELTSLKFGKSCIDCGLVCTPDNYPAFDWDHRPGEVKEFIISHSPYGKTRTLAEIAKCDLRCRNCHAIITRQRAQEREGS